MSAGVSNSSGSEQSNMFSTGTRQGTSEQNSQTQFNNTGKTQTVAPQWARQGNKEMFNERSAAGSQAVDFLSGLLTNPYDSTQPNNQFGGAINRLFDTQLARARSGDAQHMGAAKQGFREAAALVGAQDAAIGQGTSAANSLLTNASPMSNLDWARLVAPQLRQDTGNTNTTGTTTTNEQTTGTQKGNTTMEGSNSGYGITLCCFIFVEAYRGRTMPWFVRRARDEFASGPRVEGYRKLAKHLVPLMRKSALVRSAVELSMILPLTLWGGWLYGEFGKRYRLGWTMFPFVLAWFTIWALMGKEFNQEPEDMQLNLL